MPILYFPRIDTARLPLAVCRFPSPYFRYGFEFRLYGITAKRDDATHDTVYSPKKKMRVEVQVLPKEARQVIRDFPKIGWWCDGYLMIPADMSEPILGISKWKLLDLVEDQLGDELDYELSTCLLGREYEVIK